MDQLEQLSDLIGDIYDASLDPALWTSVFDKVCAYSGATEVSLLVQDHVRRLAEAHFVSTHDDHFRQLYLNKYFKINPIFPTVMFFDVEKAMTVPDLIPREEFCRTKFAREWLAPQGYIDGVFSILDKSATRCALLMVIRHVSQGFVDDELRHRFALLVPHIRRAMLIGKAINLHKVEAAMLADSLDSLAAGMFIVDATSRIVHCNAAGHAMIADGNVLRAPSGRLGATDPKADQSFLDMITAAGNGDVSLGRRGISVPLQGRNGERHIGHLLPLTSGARRKGGTAYSAAAVVFVRPSGLEMPAPHEAIAGHFKLTPAEIRVLFGIVEIGGVLEVADVLGVTEATVRTHVTHLYEKTGVNRHADLVKLVAGYTSPLVAQC